MSAPPPPSFAYRPALDGVRALAVAAVLLFHGGVAALPGGFLGVDAFFVLSGYLITSLLLNEWDRTGRIRLGAFWLRRTRRLLPALLLVLVAVVATYRAVLSAEDFALLRGDALATLAYVANWRMIYRGDDYFAQNAAPSPLQHTWSLGIEEQFYVLWPLIVVAGLALAARRPAGTPRNRAILTGRALGWLCVAGAAGSVGAGVALSASTTRVYFGTDTRAQALLIGAALAVALSGVRPADPHDLTLPRRPAWEGVAGVVGLLVAGWLWTHADGGAAWLYHGGLTVGGLAVAAVIGHAVLSPQAPIARLLALPPLVWLGRISYGVYLWHWPLFGYLNADRTGLRGPTLLATRLLATLAIAVASYVLIERPVRTGRWPVPLPRLRPRVLRIATVALTAIAAVGATAAYIVTATVPAPAQVIPPPLVLPTVPVTLRTPPMQRPDRKPGDLPRIAVFGDSVAWTLGTYLPEQTDAIVTVHAIQGCGIARLPEIIQQGEGFTNYPACPTWDERWRSNVDYRDPDVSVILLDRWELMDRKLNGEFQHVGQPEFDDYLMSELDLAIRIAGSRGAHVVLLTAPYTHRAERYDGSLYDEDLPERVDAWNRLLWTAASHRPDTVTVLDLNRLVCPDGEYTWTIGRLRIRSDGLHFTESGVEQWIAPWLLPQLKAIARGGFATAPRGD